MILLAHLSILPPGITPDPDLVERERVAQASWKPHFDRNDLGDVPLVVEDFDRIGPDGMPYVRDVFDLACSYSMGNPVCYVNADCGLTTKAAERILAGVERGNGVTVSPRRSLDPEPGKLYDSVLDFPPDGPGFDLMAFTPEWWSSHRRAIPDMLIGREAWDTVFREVAEAHADDPRIVARNVCMTPEEWGKSKAYTDDVIWHKPHVSPWQRQRTTSVSQMHNRRLARAFFEFRNNRALVEMLR